MGRSMVLFVCLLALGISDPALGLSFQTRTVGKFPQKVVTRFDFGGDAAGSSLTGLEVGKKVIVATNQGNFELDLFSGTWRKTESFPVSSSATLTIPASIPANPPVDDLLAVAKRDGKTLIGTPRGAAFFNGRRWEYFQGRGYLPCDRVAAVAFGSGDDLWLGSTCGVTRIEYVPMTLEEKAGKFEEATRARHVRHGLIADSDFTRPGDPSSNITSTSSNDGLWTAMYIAAQAYRYVATKDPEAKAFARQSFEALMFLQTVTGTPGLVARSFALPDERRCPGEWDHFSPDGNWRWKGDTSSDEIVGHYYAYSIYYDLVADEKEKEKIRQQVRLITDYIIDNNFYLLDTDGKPTTWGRWNYIGIRSLSPSRGLNSLEILSHLKVAYHITADQKYERVYRELALKHHYAFFTIDQRITIPFAVNHGSDQLAFLSYYPLLKYERDPELLNYYHRSLKRTCRIVAPEKNPLWNFIYGAVMPAGTTWDIDGPIETLQLISLDLVRWGHHNSRRDDIRIRFFRGRFNEMESFVPLPPDERMVMKWSGNPYRLDTVGDGTRGEAGSFWLLPYWLGRYYGFIQD